ncbi:MAG TPA: NADH-quinone oxidoreductase subunit L [Candidatus Limnocylindrales bacterium]|jgi:NADH-quinone oxidoreductase subunit L
MSLEQLLVVLIIALPLAGFLTTAIVGRRLGLNAFWIPVGAVVGAWAISMFVIATFHANILGSDTGLQVTLWRWIPAGGLNVDIGFYVDNLTSVLLVVVTTIGMLVHVYSIGYMRHDPGYWRFFAYLNLFMVSMLILVLADSWLVLFLAWELVGLSSYLLIGFWYRKRTAAEASKKAFITNRAGDVGFALGIMAIFVNTHTLNIRDSLASLPSSGFQFTTCASDLGGAGCPHPLMIPIWIIALLIFAGAVGKSAQFPLHVWLPDAMEGPTPVSALIHAATMVNAGVYLVARANPIFSAAPDVMVVVAGIGIFTAILAASIAMTQTDIKRVLAYSTLSQLGYMFASLGVGAWVAATFHLMTHGFFKGLLFLGSGSVIHSVHEEQDMRKMGGLRKKIPQTYRTMLIGAIAISGIPPLAGFFSKDEILGESFKNGFVWVWAIGILVAVMTAFYMFRLIGLTFWGKSRVDPTVEPKIHESPRTMTVPLWLLAIPSVFLGIVLSWPGPPLGPLFGINGKEGMLASYLAPIFQPAAVSGVIVEPSFALGGIDGLLLVISIAVAFAGMLSAWRLFGVELGPIAGGARPGLVQALTKRLSFLYRASANKWWFDDINNLLFVVIGGRFANALAWFDQNVVDGIVNGIGAVTRRSGGGLARVQTGRVQNYALGIALGLIAMAGSYFLILGR